MFPCEATDVDSLALKLEKKFSDDLKLRGEVVETMQEPFIFLHPCSQTLPDHYNSSRLDRELA